MSFGFKDKCGVVGIHGCEEAAHLCYLGLYALQHRGQESAGIVAGEGEELRRKVGAGLVADVFDEQTLADLEGTCAIGHVRYATAGDAVDRERDAQPLLVRCSAGPVAVAHNGNLVNADSLRDELERKGSIFQTSSDTEVICHLIARGEEESLLDRLRNALEQVRGAYSLTVAGDGRVYGVRDPSGVRPLVLGKVRDGYVLASETCALDLIAATFVREIEPGEVVVLDDDGVHSHRLANPENEPEARCVFEHVYFARPDSRVFGAPVHRARKFLGHELAKEQPAPADLVIPVPDSGIYAAMGYAEQSGLPFEMGMVRNHYVGRTFIEPEQRIRNFGVRLKLNPVRDIVEGKSIVVVDDSIVRGTTSRKIVETIRAAGAREVHVRISAPPTKSPCYYGIDTPTKRELIASTASVDEITKKIGADSLGYLSRKGLAAAVAKARGEESAGLPPKDGFCDACFSEEYPIQISSHRARRD